MIAVIDYGAGNLRSIAAALRTIGADAHVTEDPDQVRTADAVILPGVGHAGHCIGEMRRVGMYSAIVDVVSAGTPLLGICVGLQVMFGPQEEGDSHGFGLFPGRVRSLRNVAKLPHMGWNRVHAVNPDSDWDTATAHGGYFYFVHSYVAEPENPADVVATTIYGESFPSIVAHDNIWGTQFHPEKSGDAGIALLRHFVNRVDAKAAPSLVTS